MNELTYSASLEDAATRQPDNRYNEHPMLAAVRTNNKVYIQYHLHRNEGRAVIDQFHSCKSGTLKNRSVTPFHLAVSLLNKDMADFLLKQGADINQQMSGGQTAICYCISSSRDYSMLDLLLKKGAAIDGSAGGLSETALHVAVKMDAQRGWKERVVRILMEKQCNSTSKDKFGLAPIHYAGRLPREAATKFVKLLVQYDNRNVNLQTRPEGCTPVQQAIDANNTDLTSFLLESGAKRTIRGRVTERLNPSETLNGISEMEAYPVDKCGLLVYCFCCLFLPLRLCFKPDTEHCESSELCLKDTLCPCCKPIPLEYARNNEMRLIIQSTPRTTTAAAATNIADQQPLYYSTRYDLEPVVAQPTTSGEPVPPPSYEECCRGYNYFT